jgi:hypothetical protein
MRGEDERSGTLFSYVDLEARVGQDHLLRTIRAIVNEALAALAGVLDAVLADGTAVVPTREALASDALASVRLDPLGAALMDRLEFDLLFRGSSALASTMRRGITRRFPRTASACWKATSPPSC